MGKTIYLINGIMGIVVGLGVTIFSIVGMIKQFNANSLGWFIAGVAGVGFGIYEWKKYRSS
ncbi:hypothetical protein KY366_01945 [Candidatus Woesearchaeota archaeon]|nr:hypothetical protein [Candidatus Woesearchaeota archaeon]